MIETLRTELVPLLTDQLQPVVSEVSAVIEWRDSISADIESFSQQLAAGAEATDKMRSIVDAQAEQKNILGPRLLKKLEDERSMVASALSEIRAALSDSKSLTDKHGSDKRVLQRALSDEKEAAVALLQERLDAQSDSVAELGAALESLRGAHEEQTRQVQRQQTDLVLKQYELTAARERDKQLAQLQEQAESDATARRVLEEAVVRNGVQAELLAKLAASLEASVAGQISSHLDTLEQLAAAGGEAAATAREDAAAVRAAATSEARERATDARASAALLLRLETATVALDEEVGAATEWRRRAAEATAEQAKLRAGCEQARECQLAADGRADAADGRADAADAEARRLERRGELEAGLLAVGLREVEAALGVAEQGRLAALRAHAAEVEAAAAAVAAAEPERAALRAEVGSLAQQMEALAAAAHLAAAVAEAEARAERDAGRLALAEQTRHAAEELGQALRGAAAEAAAEREREAIERRALEEHAKGLAALLQDERSTSGGLRSRLGDEAQLASELRACRKEIAELQARLQQQQVEEERVACAAAEERTAASAERQQLLQQLLQQATAAERERAAAAAERTEAAAAAERERAEVATAAEEKKEAAATAAAAHAARLEGELLGLREALAQERAAAEVAAHGAEAAAHEAAAAHAEALRKVEERSAAAVRATAGEAQHARQQATQLVEEARRAAAARAELAEVRYAEELAAEAKRVEEVEAAKRADAAKRAEAKQAEALKQQAREHAAALRADRTAAAQELAAEAKKAEEVERVLAAERRAANAVAQEEAQRQTESDQRFALLLEQQEGLNRRHSQRLASQGLEASPGKSGGTPQSARADLSRRFGGFDAAPGGAPLEAESDLLRLRTALEPILGAPGAHAPSLASR